MEPTGTKMTPDQKIASVRKGYAAFARGDMATVSQQFTDDVVWHARGSTKYGGDFKGKSAVLGYLAMIPQDFEEFKLDVHDVVASDQHVVVLVTSTSRRKGKTYEDRAVHIHHVNDEGKTTETWFATDTEQLKEALKS